MGVWIETYGEQIRNRFGFVTPFVGVWIETQYDVAAKAFTKSHPSWVCGLKLIKKILCPVMAVTPFVGVWIETLYLQELSYQGFRHTLRGCVD